MAACAFLAIVDNVWMPSSSAEVCRTTMAALAAASSGELPSTVTKIAADRLELLCTFSRVYEGTPAASSAAFCCGLSTIWM